MQDADCPALAHADLLERLAQGLAARLTVLTPNQRLAQALVADFDARQLGAGLASWEAPDVLPFEAFVQRCHDEAACGEGGTPVARRLERPHSLLLWEEAVRASAWDGKLLSIPAAAALAADAWELAHAWGIEGAIAGFPGTEEVEAFAGWARHYRRRLERGGFVDAAGLSGAVAALVRARSIALPAQLVLFGFDLVTPRQRALLDALRGAGVAILASAFPPEQARVQRTTFESPRVELEHAARWARMRLEAAPAGRTPRIGIVVPRLEQRLGQVERVFGRTLGANGGAPLFNVSLGRPLAACALIDGALALLEGAAGPLPYERASRLLRSPFIAGAATEGAARARLDAQLRRIAPASLTLLRLRALLAERDAGGDCPVLAHVLERVVVAATAGGRAAPHEWARRFTQLLDAAGFPGERALDSAEFQALGKWREVLATFATLGAVAASWGAPEARARLRRLCADTLFQPASGAAPVQVLGILESAGLAFDHLWVSGLTEEEWPVPARPHPLIAPALQRKAGIAQAVPEHALEIDRALTRRWCAAAPEVVLSCARMEEDRELLPSGLIAEWPETAPEALGIVEFPSRRRALFEAAQSQAAWTTRSEAGPAITDAAARGGTAILADQAACPFRAFAHFRLDARALESPAAGLDASERGHLLHGMMARLWEGLRDHATLVALDRERLDTALDEAAEHAIARFRMRRPGRLEGGLAQVERARLARTAREWLEIERGRAPFTVVAREAPVTLSAGPLHLNGRVDRVDELAEGGRVLLDYKSGAVSAGQWLDERPDDAQMPLYALAMSADLRAVAFACLKTGELGFAGIARDAELLPGVRTLERQASGSRFAASWSELLARWGEVTDRLGRAFAAGEAAIDPKRMAATCERCDLAPLCRVHERLAAVSEGEEPA